MQLVIMNFRDASIHIYQMETNMDSEQVETWIQEETDFNLDEVQYMTSETPIEIINH
jgi:hypothetical protein